MKRRHLRLLVTAVFLSALLMVGLAATPLGLHLAAWAIERTSAPGLELHAPAGSLLGTLKIARIVHAAGDWQVVAENLELRWRPQAEGFFVIEQLDIGRLQLTSRSSERPFEPPAALTLPVAMSVLKFKIDDVKFTKDGKPAFEAGDIEGRFASDGRQHRLEALKLSTARLVFEASGTLGGRAPFPLTADLRVAGEELGHAFVVQVKGDGPLNALKLVAHSATGPQQVGGEAVLDVFARQPLVRGRLTAAEIDPSAWLKGAPHARLRVQAEFGADRGANRVFRGTLSVVNDMPGRLDEARIPLNRFQAEGYGDERRIVVPRFTAALAGGEVTGAATWTDGDISADVRLSGVDAAAWHKTLPKTRLGGDVKFEARPPARGDSGRAPSLSLHWALRDSTVSGRALAGHGDVVLRPDALERADMTMRAGDNTVEVRGRLGEPQDTLIVAIDAPHLEQIGLGGVVHGDITLSGPLRAPGARWTLAAPQLAIPGRAYARGLASEGRWDVGGGGTVALDLTIAQLKAGSEAPPLADISISVDGRRDAHRVAASAKVGGDHAVRIDGKGGFNGQTWRGRVDTLAWEGPHPVRLADSTSLEIGAGHVVMSRATIAGDDWQAVIDGLNWDSGRLQSSGRFGGLPIAALLPATAAATTLRIGGDWQLDFSRRADGRIRVFRERGDVTLEAGAQALALGLERLELAADFTGQQATVSLHAAGQHAGTLTGRFTAGLRQEDGRWILARQAPWQGSLRLATPSIAWLSPLTGENVLLGGRVDAAVDVGGTPALPTTHGRVEADELRVALLDYGLDLNGGVLRVDFTPEAVRLRRFELVSAATQRPREGRIDFEQLTARPGRLIAEGEIALEDGSGRIRLQADRVAASALSDRWVMVSGTGSVRFADGELALSGDATVDAAYVELAPAGRPTLSADVVVLGRQKKERRFARVGLDLSLNLGERFYFHGAGLQSRLAGELRLAADRDVLRARGSVRAVEGTFQAYGRELAVERGILNFQGLADNPGLNVRALRKNQQVEAGVEVTGTLKNPTVRLVSVPDVPDTEKLSWMLLGRAPGGALGAEDADLLLYAAMSLRGKQGQAPLQSLMHGLGLEELGISSGSLGARGRFSSGHVAGTFEPGAASAAESIATVGKRIGTKAVLSYEHSLTSAESIVKLTLELSRRVSVVARFYAENSIGLVYSFAFGGGGKP